MRFLLWLRLYWHYLNGRAARCSVCDRIVANYFVSERGGKRFRECVPCLLGRRAL